jgi:hypothetical protein
VLSESIRELTVLMEPLMTVLTALLRLAVDEIAPERELLIRERDALCPVLTETALLKELLCPLMTVLTAVLRLPVDEIVPLKELLSSDSDVL